MKLVISIDVEEEGLFSGRYAQTASVLNVARLYGLEFVSRDLGLPLTLLADYPVLADSGARNILLDFKERHQAEIGAHLHHWTTPPFEPLPCSEPVPCQLLPAGLLRRKLESLLERMDRGLQSRPRSFRMGRFDFGPAIRELLPEYGIGVDSSLVPLRAPANGPDHFLVPPDPHPLSPVLWETPVTMIPLFRGFPVLVYTLAQKLPPEARYRLLKLYRMTCALGIHPLWHPLATMRRAVRLHHARGGRVLNMFLHSSELMPGGCPKIRTEADARQLIRKMRVFFVWLLEHYEIEGVTLADTVGMPADLGGNKCGIVG